MSRPRKPYGPNPPGRLLGTMIKVLAAEMSDQGRLARGKRYWSDDAVTDIVVGHGAVTAEVQGSRSQPYVVTVEADGGEGVPGKREIWAQCTCPDDTGTGVDLCKHAVAVMFALADEVTIEPELVDRWRAGRRSARPARDTDLETSHDRDDSHDDDHDHDHDHGADDAEIARLPTSTRSGERAEAATRPGDEGSGADVIELRPRVEPDAISPMLGWPDGAGAPTFPEVTELRHPPFRDRRIGDVLDDALEHLAIRWE